MSIDSTSIAIEERGREDSKKGVQYLICSRAASVVVLFLLLCLCLFVTGICGILVYIVGWGMNVSSLICGF